MYFTCAEFFLIFGVVLVSGSYSKKVELLKNVINDGINGALKFEFPTDAKNFRAPQEPIREIIGSYDFVIIGAGTAGSVVANRLSETKDSNVLVLEAGNFTSNDGFNQFLYYFLPFLINTPLNWGYKSIPQKHACLGFVNETCLVPRGLGVGGTTLINAGACSRGNPENYDQWADITQDPSWKYENILKYFKKSETFHWTNRKAPIDLEYHGEHGLIQVQHKIPDFITSDSFVEANKKLGIYPTDYNGPNELGTSFFQLYSKNGKRQDMGSVFLEPFLNRTNLNVLTGAYVTKIEINKITNEAESVLFTQNGFTYRVRAKKEVILSAGAISSPQILMLSGVGPKEHLQELGIDVIENLQVGDKLQDHPSITLRLSSNLTLPKETLEQQIKDYLKGVGTLTAPVLQQAIGFYTINSTNDRIPNIEFISSIFQKTEEEIKLMRYKPEVYHALWGNEKSHVSFLINNINPKSSGSIKLKSKDPFDYPLIDLNLLSDSKNEDIEALYQAIEFVLKLTGTEDYKKFDLQYLAGPLPPCKDLPFKSREYWYCFIRQIAETFYHPVSSCRMGSTKNNGAVVDSNLQVFGVRKLRVVDTSVFPTTISGHTSIPVVMVAEKISDVIKSKYYSYCSKRQFPQLFKKR